MGQERRESRQGPGKEGEWAKTGRIGKEEMKEKDGREMREWQKSIPDWGDGFYHLRT